MFLIVWKVHKEKFVITIDSAILSKSYAHFLNTYIKHRQRWQVSCNFCEGTVRRTYSLLLAIFLCFEWRGICSVRLSWWADYLSAIWQMNFPAPLWNGRWCWVFYPPQSWRLYFQVLSDKKELWSQARVHHFCRWEPILHCWQINFLQKRSLP